MPSIKIQSNEGEVFAVETEIAKKSGTIRNMLEDLGMEEDADNEEAEAKAIAEAEAKAIAETKAEADAAEAEVTTLAAAEERPD